MNKTGQLTLIIIVGVVIVGAIGGLLLLRGSLNKKPYDEKVSALRDNLLSCFESNYKFVLESNSFQGGYYDKPNAKALSVNEFFIPYYYYKGEVYFPSTSSIEDELGKSAKNMIHVCVDYYFERDNSFDLSYDNYEVYAQIEKKEVIFNTNMKLTVKYDNKTVILDLTDSKVPVRSNIGSMHELAKVIVDQATESEYEWIGLTEIFEEARKRDLNVTIMDVGDDENSYLFVIEENAQDTFPTKLQFLNKYNLIDIGFPVSFS